MLYRLTDRRDLKIDNTTFERRKYGISLTVLTVFLVISYLLIVAPLFLHIENYFQFVVISSALSLSIIGVIVFLYVYKLRDIMFVIEFQNSVFAGAARANNEFCLIFSKDGYTVYSDNGFDKYFITDKKSNLNSFASFLEKGQLSEDDKNKLMQAVNENRSEEIIFKLDSGDEEKEIKIWLEPLKVMPDDEKKYFNLVINPLKRHAGLFFLTGKVVKCSNKAEEIFNKLNEAIYSVNDKGKITYFNEAFAKKLKYTYDELKIIEPNLKTIKPHPSKAFMTRTGKELHLSEMPLNLSQDQDLDKTYYLVQEGFKQSENAISAEKFWSDFENTPTAKAFENSPIATALLYKDGSVKIPNAAFRSMVEKYFENTGWSILEVMPEQYLKAVENQLNSAVNESITNPVNTKPVEIKLAGKKGLTALLYINKLVDSTDDSKTMLVAYLIDITEHKALEMHFAHSQKMQAVGQLAGGIAHDFNNLLTAMTGFCDLLLIRHPAGDQSFANIMQIKQNATRAANLVKQLLAFSRKQVLQPKVLDISDVLAELSDLIRRLIGENIELKLNHGKDLKLVKVDQGQFEQVIINLAVNARDAMISGGTLSISTQNVTVDKHYYLDPQIIRPLDDEQLEYGEYVLIEVEDTGSGIPEEIIRKVFEPFFSTKEVGAGTGLGLSTVYGIIKQTNGNIYLKSKEGIGTKFYIYLKACSEKKMGIDDITHTNDNQEKIVSDDLTGNGTILLVEDEMPVRMFAAHALTNKGYKILEADNADSAIEMIKNNNEKIDVIISDVIMPGISGPAMISEIKKSLPDVKVIFISGYAEDTFINSFCNDQLSYFLPKPFTLKELAHKVKEVMNKKITPDLKVINAN
jgi:signal transduction histidine kinase/ActR/RegA family two-component response regulator/PAS domain-containing protein